MSVKLMAEVWTIVLSKGQRDVLLVMADHANDNGLCYPGNLLIAWKTDYSIRQVRRIRRSLEDVGIVEVIDHAAGGSGNTPLCQLRLEKGVKKSPFEEWKKSQKGDARASSFDESKRGTSSAQKGDIGGQKGGHLDVPRTIEPPENHHPSGGTTDVAPNDGTKNEELGNEDAVHDGDVVGVVTGDDGQLQVLVAGDPTPDNVRTVANVNQILADIIGEDRRHLTNEWVARLGKEIKRLRDQGIDVQIIVEAGRLLKAKNLPPTPSAIDGFVLQASRSFASRVRGAAVTEEIYACELCDDSGFLLADDGAPLEPIVKCSHNRAPAEGVA